MYKLTRCMITLFYTGTLCLAGLILPVLAMGATTSFPAHDEFVAYDVYPEVIHQEVPEYPPAVARLGVEGTVWIKALVDTKGDVEDAIVYKSSDVLLLDDAALEASQEYRFKPGSIDGKPIAMWVTFDIEFVFDYTPPPTVDVTSAASDTLQKTAEVDTDEAL